MNISEKIRKRVMKYELREPIFFEELIKGIESNKGAAYAIINKLKKEGIINQYLKGIYYRPRKTKYGTLSIDRDLLIKEKYIGENQDKGYITGPDVWNKWGLTTQVSNRKWISQNVSRTSTNENLKIFITKSKVEIRKENVKMLQFLDVIEQLNKIPDTSNEKTLKKLIEIYKVQLSVYEKMNIFEFAEFYTKKVQILVGLIAETASIEDEYYEVILEKYRKMLKNSISKRIELNLEPTVFNNNRNWSNEYDTTRIVS